LVGPSRRSARGELATREIGLELLGDCPGQTHVGFLEVAQEGREVLADRSMEEGLFGFPTTVGRRLRGLRTEHAHERRQPCQASPKREAPRRVRPRPAFRRWFGFRISSAGANSVQSRRGDWGQSAQNRRLRRRNTENTESTDRHARSACGRREQQSFTTLPATVRHSWRTCWNLRVKEAEEPCS